MKDLRIAKDGNTIYLTVTSETEKEQKKILHSIKLITETILMNKDITVEDLLGAKPVERPAPEPLSGAEEVKIEKKELSKKEMPKKKEKPEEVKIEKAEIHIPDEKPSVSEEENIKEKIEQQKEKELKEISENIKNDICPICGNKLEYGKYGKLCRACKFQTRVYGVVTSPEMIYDLRKNRRTEIGTYKSRQGDFTGRLIMLNGKMEFRGETA